MESEREGGREGERMDGWRAREMDTGFVLYIYIYIYIYPGLYGRTATEIESQSMYTYASQYVHASMQTCMHIYTYTLSVLVARERKRR